MVIGLVIAIERELQAFLADGGSVETVRVGRREAYHAKREREKNRNEQERLCGIGREYKRDRGNTSNERQHPDGRQCGADGVAEGCVSFVAEGCACGGDAMLRLGDGDARRRSRGDHPVGDRDKRGRSRNGRDARCPSATDKMSVVLGSRQDGGSPYAPDKRGRFSACFLACRGRKGLIQWRQLLQGGKRC